MSQLSPLPARLIAAAAILTLTTTLSLALGTKPQEDDEAVIARIHPVASVEMAAKPGGTGEAKSGEELVKTICAVCHQAGVAGAPKIGDKAAWAPRLGQGLDGLVKSATAGKNAMPPRGGAELTPDELTRAIVFMTNKSGASFKEPAAKK